MDTEVKIRVGGYCRISQEDGSDESQSIGNQKNVIEEYAQSKGLSLCKFYVDDGYSGTNFNRPGFEEMLEDIENKRIDIVIVKDLSRFGRNYIQTGLYLEDYFPEKGIRFIAISDNYDTDAINSDDIIPFRNIINEWYAKDISKKIRSTLENQAKNGVIKKTAIPTFGYCFNERNEKVPDYITAPIVKLIFKLYIQTGSITYIMKYLKDNKIRIPSYYNAIKYNVNSKKILAMSDEKLITWQRDTIACILKNEAYIGTHKTQLTKSLNYKNRKRKRNKNCYVFENSFEPIIDIETFEIANTLKRRTRTGSIPYDENIFKGLLYCADCGELMRCKRIKNKKSQQYSTRYCCDENTCEYCNTISKKDLLEHCTKEIRKLQNRILYRKDMFIEFAQRKENEGKILLLNSEKDLAKLKSRNSEIDSFIQKTIEQCSKGIMTEEMSNQIIQKYATEKEDLQYKINKLERKVRREKDTKEVVKYANYLINALEDSVNEKELSTQTLHKVIKQINVHAESINKCVWKRKNDIEIIYAYCDDIINEFLKFKSY